MSEKENNDYFFKCICGLTIEHEKFDTFLQRIIGHFFLWHTVYSEHSAYNPHTGEKIKE